VLFFDHNFPNGKNKNTRTHSTGFRLLETGADMSKTRNGRYYCQNITCYQPPKHNTVLVWGHRTTEKDVQEDKKSTLAASSDVDGRQ